MQFPILWIGDEGLSKLWFTMTVMYRINQQQQQSSDRHTHATEWILLIDGSNRVRL
jgi:hypothetical protein